MATLLRPSGDDGPGLGSKVGRWMAGAVDRPAAPEPPASVPRPWRSASAARRRAEVTAARRRSAPALWAMRIGALVVVALLLVAFALLVGAVA